jgi:hypothetical protein
MDPIVGEGLGQRKRRQGEVFMFVKAIFPSFFFLPPPTLHEAAVMSESLALTSPKSMRW